MKRNPLTTLLIVSFILVQSSQNLVNTSLSSVYLFQDDFNNGNTTNWNVISGNWSVVNQEYVCQMQGLNLRCTSEAGEEIWADYVVEVSVKIVDGIDAGIDVRRSSLGDFYSINLRRSGIPGTPDIRLWKSSDGSQPTLLLDVPFTLVANTWYSVKIVLAGARIQVFIDGTMALDYIDTSSPILNGKIALAGWSGNVGVSKVHFDNVLVTRPCEIPFFSQIDDNWRDHPLRTSNNACSAYCSTIGHCGCTLTSAAMVFKTFGASTNPPQLSDCMNTSACPYAWATGATCSQGKAKWVSRPDFSWAILDHQLNQNHRPILLGMCKKGTCQYDYDNDPETYSQTHWVVVLSGQGSDPANYRIHDPAFKCGASIPLSTRSEDWEFTWIGIYEGTVPCGSLTALTPPCVSRGANPQPVQLNLDQSTNDALPSQTISSASVVSGTVWIYTRTELTMTVEITATSSVGNITDVLIWSDTISNTTWQPFTPFVWLPVSNMVYASFRDDLGNVTDVYSDTINPVGPPNAPPQVFLPLIGR